MALIADPILNSPFPRAGAPLRARRDGITHEILTGRRPSSHFVPIPRAKNLGKQLQFETEWTKTGSSQIRSWIASGSVSAPGVKPLFLCQIEAAETAIYMALKTRLVPGRSSSWRC